MGKFKVKRRNSKTNVCFVLLIALLLLSLSSCSLLFGNDDDIKRMMDYMSDKYDEEFVLGEIAIRQASNTDILVFPKEHENDWDWEICVRMDHENGDQLSDTYLNMIYREEVCAEIKAIADNVFGGDCIVTNDSIYNGDSTLIPSSFAVDSSVSEFISQGTSFSDISVSASENGVSTQTGEVQDELLIKFTRELDDRGYSLLFDIIFIKDEAWNILANEHDHAEKLSLVADYRSEARTMGLADGNDLKTVAYGRFNFENDELDGEWFNYYK